MIDISRNLVREKGIYTDPDPYSGHPINNEIKQLVENYYLDRNYYLDYDYDCTRQSPNKNDTKCSH